MLTLCSALRGEECLLHVSGTAATATAAAAAAALTLHAPHSAQAQRKPATLARVCLSYLEMNVHGVSLRPPQHCCLTRLQHEAVLVS